MGKILESICTRISAPPHQEKVGGGGRVKGQKGQKRPRFPTPRFSVPFVPSASAAARAPDPIFNRASSSPPRHHHIQCPTTERRDQSRPSSCSIPELKRGFPAPSATPTCAPGTAELTRDGEGTSGEGSKRSRYSFFLHVRKARERGGAGTTNASYLTVRPGQSGSWSRRRAGRKGGSTATAAPRARHTGRRARGDGKRGVGTMVSDVAMLVPSFSISLQSPVLRPSPHHYSPFQLTSSCSFRSLGRPKLRGVYKLPLEERAEPHFKGHGLPQASVLSREIGLTTLLSAPLPASLLSSRAPPLHAHAPSSLPSDSAPPGQVVPSGLRTRVGLQEGRERGA